MDKPLILGVRSDLDPNRLLTYDGGRPVPRKWYGDGFDYDEATPTDAQIYQNALDAGLPRDPDIEARLNQGEKPI